MRNFLRLIAALITLIAVVLLPLALFGLQVGQILYSPESMLNLVAGEIVGPSSSNVLADTLLRTIPSQLGIDEASVLGEALATIVTQSELNGTLLPPELQLEYAAQGLNSFYAWLEGADPMPVLALDMEPLKSHLSRNATSLVSGALDLLPICTAEESLTLAATLIGAALSGELVLESIPPCLPPIIPLETIAPAAGELLRQQLNTIPQTIVLNNLIQATPESMAELKGRLQLLKGALYWSWLPFAFLLVIAAFVGGQTRDGVPRWLGWSLLVVALLTFLLSLVPVSWWLAAIIPQLAGWPLPLILQIPVVSILGAVFEQAGQSLTWLAVGFAILGIALILLASFLGRREKTPAF